MITLDGTSGITTPTTDSTAELTPAEKLASAGLTVDELKELLGITV